MNMVFHKNKRISVAIISSAVTKTPDGVAYRWIFDEAQRLSTKGIEVHVIRSKVEKDSYSYGIHFHGIKRFLEVSAIKLMLNILRKIKQIWHLFE